MNLFKRRIIIIFSHGPYFTLGRNNENEIRHYFDEADLDTLELDWTVGAGVDINKPLLNSFSNLVNLPKFSKYLEHENLGNFMVHLRFMTFAPDFSKPSVLPTIRNCSVTVAKNNWVDHKSFLSLLEWQNNGFETHWFFQRVGSTSVYVSFDSILLSYLDMEEPGVCKIVESVVSTYLETKQQLGESFYFMIHHVENMGCLMFKDLWPLSPYCTLPTFLDVSIVRQVFDYLEGKEVHELTISRFHLRVNIGVDLRPSRKVRRLDLLIKEPAMTLWQNATHSSLGKIIACSRFPNLNTLHISFDSYTMFFNVLTKMQVSDSIESITRLKLDSTLEHNCRMFVTPGRANAVLYLLISLLKKLPKLKKLWFWPRCDEWGGVNYAELESNFFHGFVRYAFTLVNIQKWTLDMSMGCPWLTQHLFEKLYKVTEAQECEGYVKYERWKLQVKLYELES